MATLVIFGVFWDRMANLGLIDFKPGLYINVNTGQNKFEVHMPLLGKNIKFGQEHYEKIRA